MKSWMARVDGGHKWLWFPLIDELLFLLKFLHNRVQRQKLVFGTHER